MISMLLAFGMSMLAFGQFGWVRGRKFSCDIFSVELDQPCAFDFLGVGGRWTISWRGWT